MPHEQLGADAVCFTAGPKGAPFSAGVIHAFLASDRPAPTVAAGISSGALSAAALERSFRELAQAAPNTPEREVARWNWFRRYLETITNSPLDVIWNAIPDPGDFFADKPPVSDLSVRSLPPSLRAEENAARDNYYRLVRLGVWLAGLGVSVGDVARALVSWVRFREQYALWGWQWIRLVFFGAVMAVKVFTHLCLSPQFVFEKPSWSRWRLPRPLFGWPTWLLSIALMGCTAAGALQLLVVVLPKARTAIDSNWNWLSTLISLLGGGAGALAPFLPKLVRGLPDFILGLLAKAPNLVLWVGGVSFFGVGAILLWALVQTRNVTTYLLGQVGIARGLLHQYHLHRKLFELFRSGPLDVHEPLVPDPANGGSMHVIIVAAPLQRIPKVRGQQVWATPGSKLVNALLAALAAPGLFPPITLQGNQRDDWEIENPPSRVDLIDGAAVRQNPLPAFFAWLRKGQQHLVARALSSAGPDDARVHVVYNVPIQPYADPTSPPRETIDIITAAFNSLELAKRRDTKLEYRQTNFISEMEARIQALEKSPPLQAFAATAGGVIESNPIAGASGGVTPTQPANPAFPIFADEIAPQTDIGFQNNLAPQRSELLEVVASGCRLTLGRLYRSRLKDLMNGPDHVPCHVLLQQVAPGRKVLEASPGLNEVCNACSKKLRPAASESDLTPKVNVRGNEFQHLDGSRSRIVFVASGGVFRGAFHIGVIAAMQAAKIRPDLIVGASVGSLMGGALAAISTSTPPANLTLLAQLCLTFLHVDREIALTRTLKNAAKQLGTRTRSVKLSPSRLRRMIRRGVAADSAYAVTGAPPALIDAISTAFLFPNDCTREIAAEFVAGHITKAMNCFWKAVRGETLRRLEIESSLMGTTLIEDAARKLLGQTAGFSLDTTQPYHQHQVSFFATTSDLNRKEGLLLPRDLKNVTSYDFIKAALSSSAFPVVFAPRQESEVLPGTGKTNVLFSDGGMFDNLPFFPAIEVLSSIQQQARPGLQKESREALQDRQSHPDLFIAGALESEDIPENEADNAIEIYRRAGNLNVNIKLNSFRDTSRLIDEQISKMLHASANKQLPPGTPEFMDSIVPAAVLKIAPTDSKHLNGTYAFCRAMGLKAQTVRTSIADGCFQTLDTLAQTHPPASLEQRAFDSLIGSNRMDEVRHRPFASDKTHCPFFSVHPGPDGPKEHDANTFECPFIGASNSAPDESQKQELRRIFEGCIHDRSHRSRNRTAIRTQKGSASADSPSLTATPAPNP